MDIHEICPTFNPATHRVGDSFTDTLDHERNRIVRQWSVEPIPTAQLLASRRAAVKGEAERRILVVAPEWRQRNLTARAAELALTYPGTAGVDLPEPERAEFLAQQEIWSRIRAIQDASNGIEAALNAAAEAPGATAIDLIAVDILAGWPE